MGRNHFARECCQHPGISMRAMQARLLWEALGPPGPRHDAKKHREQDRSSHARVVDLVPGIVEHAAGPSHTHELPAPLVTLREE
jgi:hypothetical protein